MQVSLFTHMLLKNDEALILFQNLKKKTILYYTFIILNVNIEYFTVYHIKSLEIFFF